MADRISGNYFRQLYERLLEWTDKNAAQKVAQELYNVSRHFDFELEDVGVDEIVYELGVVLDDNDRTKYNPDSPYSSWDKNHREDKLLYLVGVNNSFSKNGQTREQIRTEWFRVGRVTFGYGYQHKNLEYLKINDKTVATCFYEQTDQINYLKEKGIVLDLSHLEKNALELYL